MPYFTKPEKLEMILQEIKKTTKEPNTLEAVNEALSVLRELDVNEQLGKLAVAVQEHCDKLDAIGGRLQEAIRTGMTDRITLTTIHRDLIQAISNLHVMVTCS
jgi:hypothetical protein